MLNRAVQELMSQIDGAVQGAVRDVVENEQWNLDQYLAAVDCDEEHKTYDSRTGVTITFTSDHRVYARVPTGVAERDAWTFIKPKLNEFIEVECEGVFEELLNVTD